jgi:hypothetical protein
MVMPTRRRDSTMPIDSSTRIVQTDDCCGMLCDVKHY